MQKCKVISLILGCVCCTLLMPITAYANNGAVTATTYDINTETAGQVTYVSIDESDQITDTTFDVGIDVGGTIEGSNAEGEEGETTATTTVAANTTMDGQFETRELSQEELMELDRIRSELEAEKKNQFSGVFATISNIVGIVICIYTFLVLLMWILDKVNFVGDIEFVRLITVNHATTLKDEDDKEYVRNMNPQIYILTNKTIFLNTAVGVGVGLLLINSDKLINAVQYIYATLQSLFEGGV